MYASTAVPHLSAVHRDDDRIRILHVYDHADARPHVYVHECALLHHEYAHGCARAHDHVRRIHIRNGCVLRLSYALSIYPPFNFQLLNRYFFNIPKYKVSLSGIVVFIISPPPAFCKQFHSF